MKLEKERVNAGAVINAINALANPQSALSSATNDYNSIGSWKFWQTIQTVASGAFANFIPVAHIPASAGDVLFLMHKMAHVAWGIGALHDCPLDNAKEDMAIILGLWAQAIEENQLNEIFDKWTDTGVLALSNAGRSAPNSVLQSPVMETQEKIVLEKGGAKAMGVVGGLLLRKIATTAATRFSALAGGKYISGFFLLAGPIVGGSINLWLMRDVSNAADVYYRNKKAYFDKIKEKPEGQKAEVSAKA